jgi:glycosyltransferase involved in cell wall biosynthesis
MRLKTIAVSFGLRSLLKRLGKSDQKVAAVFGYTAEACHTAVVHLREGAPEVPVWLFAATQPLPETAALCQRVQVHRSSLLLLLHAEQQLWPRWVALSVATWTGERGRWPLKLAPFLVPPFRSLLLNRHGDFLSGTPANIVLHCRHRFREASHSSWNRVKDLSRAYWLLLTYHIWRSGPVTRVKDLAHSYSLLVAATLLGWLSYPDRHLFRRLHGDAPLPLSSPASGGAGLVRHQWNGSPWNGPELEKLVREGDARWILFHEGPADAEVDDMLPLFEDERTFAVSRQADFRAWKPMLLPMAPFRTLQPGEASQVLAPISRTILVDREKLAALGIPRSSMAGMAWMLLFWKAAAAGWRSYSLGNGNQLSQQPDFPIEERAFILRVLLDPALRRLGPREMKLARGNIGFAPSLRMAGKPKPDRLKVLLVSPFLPYPLSHGGAVRIYNLCRALASRVDFTLVALRETHDSVDYRKLHEVFREVHILDRDEPAKGDARLPRQVRQHQSHSLRGLIAELCRISRPDVLQIEYTHMAAFRDSAPEVPAILVEHDVTFALYRQLADQGRSKAARREYQRWLEFERRWLGKYDTVHTVSEEDRQTVMREGGRGPDRTTLIPNGVDTVRFAPREEPAAVPEILYIGSFRHMPNILGFEKLRKEIMPAVWSKFSEARLRVVAGPEHEWFWREFRRKDRPESLDHRIEVHGFVEDLRPLYARASIAVAPLPVSAGTNIKVLEAMACGKATVSTPVGCAGLGLQDGHDILIRSDWKDFAGAICGLLADPALRSRLAAHARQTVEERFSWTDIADSMYQSYLATAVQPGA